MADHAALPGNVAVAADIAGREVASVVNVTQIATIDRTALEDRLGDIPDWLLAQVDAGLTRTLALTHT
jgi:mRNA interferase MazF